MNKDQENELNDPTYGAIQFMRRLLDDALILVDREQMKQKNKND